MHLTAFPIPVLDRIFSFLHPRSQIVPALGLTCRALSTCPLRRLTRELRERIPEDGSSFAVWQRFVYRYGKRVTLTFTDDDDFNSCILAQIRFLLSLHFPLYLIFHVHNHGNAVQNKLLELEAILMHMPYRVCYAFDGLLLHTDSLLDVHRRLAARAVFVVGHAPDCGSIDASQWAEVTQRLPTLAIVRCVDETHAAWLERSLCASHEAIKRDGRALQSMHPILVETSLRNHDMHVRNEVTLDSLAQRVSKGNMMPTVVHLQLQRDDSRLDPWRTYVCQHLHTVCVSVNPQTVKLLSQLHGVRQLELTVIEDDLPQEGAQQSCLLHMPSLSYLEKLTVRTGRQVSGHIVFRMEKQPQLRVLKCESTRGSTCLEFTSATRQELEVTADRQTQRLVLQSWAPALEELETPLANGIDAFYLSASDSLLKVRLNRVPEEQSTQQIALHVHAPSLWKMHYRPCSSTQLRIVSHDSPFVQLVHEEEEETDLSLFEALRHKHS
jgi:hypothetical protein